MFWWDLSQENSIFDNWEKLALDAVLKTEGFTEFWNKLYISLVVSNRLNFAPYNWTKHND